MVQAILEGRKTQTRRVVKPQPIGERLALDMWEDGIVRQCPYGLPGDRLWVRETFARFEGDSPNDFETGDGWIYRASVQPEHDDGIKWRPSIHMPREASRILLEITDVRIERLQEITEEDARAEGEKADVFLGDTATAIVPFALRWDDIYGPGVYAMNPWVWVITFKRIQP